MNDLPRHSFISYRLATIHDENKVAREAGNSPDIIFSNYHETTTGHAAKLYFGIGPYS
ncbi:hypothetical protein [Ruficoccus sp. ZRK36]|uniref:hypothetical protein n=1 Tax=Ruficoccus sp. ZRK36 TaxID=2866311 RepID=UPI001C73975B|nr:hypothetical protein [Ruficoccus sp. ZRK36]QYY36858.1 hypothetical protein K0V07_05115 [Ruficoccus sp. ZRK36]